MNPFDIVVYAIAFIAIVMGFNTGLLRSFATMIGYLVAAPIAVALTPHLAPLVPDSANLPLGRTSLVLVAAFLVFGIALGALLRVAVSEFTGEQISIVDRLAGALLAAIRIALVAILVVLVFDRMIPANRQPAFLIGSKLRPYLSMAGQRGLKSLPPEVELYIDSIKRERAL
jgi:membrane protein required for colicin V production